MKINLTPTQQFIQAAAFIWNAVQELDQAASRNHEIGRFALAEFNRLDGKLQTEIRAWNENLEDGDLAVFECTDAGSKGCGIYSTDAPRDLLTLCGPCGERRAEHLRERMAS